MPADTLSMKGPLMSGTQYDWGHMQSGRTVGNNDTASM
jgi:hypothetical protein